MSEPKANDLTLRFCLQVSFPEPDEEEKWDAFNSFSTPIEALHGCSDCLDTVMLLLGDPNLDDDFVRIRVWDAEDQRMVFWEDAKGRLNWDEAVFEGGD